VRIGGEANGFARNPATLQTSTFGAGAAAGCRKPVGITPTIV
jgi:hypothetical protein